MGKNKLEKEIIAMEMSLGIIKRSKKEEIAKHQRKKANKGYIWKSGRDIESKNKKKRNYADKILKSHEQKKKKKKDKIIKQPSSNHSIAIQSEQPIATQKEEEKEESVPISIQTSQIKKCCYHCFKLFILDNNSTHNEDKYFCDEYCLSKYIESTMISCSHKECQTKFNRTNGNRFHGKWFCRIHFKQCCVDEMET